MGEMGSDRVTDVVDEVYFFPLTFFFFLHVVLSRSVFCDLL